MSIMSAKFLLTVEFVATFCFFSFFTVVFPPAPDYSLIRNTKRPSDQSTQHRYAHGIDLESCLSEFEAASMDAV